MPPAPRSSSWATVAGSTRSGSNCSWPAAISSCFDWLVARSKRVFVDLKFFDVPATVGSAVRQLQGRGATFATVHGNDAIIEAAVANRGDTKILAVTVLTSLDEGDMRDLGFQADPRAVVLSRARRALALDCDGLVSSGLEVAQIREETGDRMIVVCPGIRPVANREGRRPEAHRGCRGRLPLRRRLHCRRPADPQCPRPGRRRRRHPAPDFGAVCRLTCCYQTINGSRIGLTFIP